MERITVNPDSYSQLPLKFEDLEFIQYIGHDSGSQYRDIQTGEGYFELTHNYEIQEFVTRLLKGIIPIADIVVVLKPDGEKLYLSKKITLGDYDPVQDENIEACNLVLKSVFNDHDHYKDYSGVWKNALYADGRFVFYDFGEVYDLFMDAYIFKVHTLPEFQTFEPNILILFSKKIQLLKERLQGLDGLRFMEAVLAKVKIDKDGLEGNDSMFEDGTEMNASEFRSFLIGRIDEIFEKVDQVIKMKND